MSVAEAAYSLAAPYAMEDRHLDRYSELKAFDDSKSGVKGLADSGITKIPRIFVRPPDSLAQDSSDEISEKFGSIPFEIPVLDLSEISGKREKVVAEVRRAAEGVGFFRIVNHGVPIGLLEKMIEATRRFHELPNYAKAKYYSRDAEKRFKYNSNFDLYSTSFASWRDTVFCVMRPDPPDATEWPTVWSDTAMEYSKSIDKLATTLFELFSEALGLKKNQLRKLGCGEHQALLGHYYPPCPQPELTLGTSTHSDPDLMTILLQDDMGGLQISNGGRWIDVPPSTGALVVNIGDLLQMMSNDKFKSVDHRVLSSRSGPRVSVACFLMVRPEQVLGPITEILSEENPALYGEVTLSDFYADHLAKGLEGEPRLARLRLQKNPTTK